MTSVLTPPVAHPATPAIQPRRLRQFTVAEYHRMIEIGILGENDPVELLEGWIVLKMPRNPPHDSSVQRLTKLLLRLVPAGWDVRVQSAITTGDSEPEPDFAVVRGDDLTYRQRHPGPADVAWLIEVADSSLGSDLLDKTRLYAQAGIVCYWIVNLIDRQIEVHTEPTGPDPSPAYSRREVYGRSDLVPLVIDSLEVARIAVAELVP